MIRLIRTLIIVILLLVGIVYLLSLNSDEQNLLKELISDPPNISEVQKKSEARKREIQREVERIENGY